LAEVLELAGVLKLGGVLKLAEVLELVVLNGFVCEVLVSEELLYNCII
jgi:hypothetical protein